MNRRRLLSRAARTTTAVVTVALLSTCASAWAAPGPTSTAVPTPPGAPTSAPPAGGPTTTAPRSLAGASPDGTDLPYLGDTRADPDLGGVAVDTPEFRKALATYRTSEKALQTAKSVHADAVSKLAELAAAEARLVGTLNQAVRRKEKSDGRLEQLRDSLRRMAVEDYVRGDSAGVANLDLDLTGATDARSRKVLVKTVRGHQLAEARANTIVVDDMTALILTSQNQLDGVRALIVSTTATRDQALADQVRLTGVLPVQAKAIADARLTGGVPGLDFTFVVLDAYYKAAKALNVEKPSCRIRWTLIAAIGRTESRHGTYDDAVVDADGNESKPIYGVSLDGSSGTALVADTDAGEIDGDPNGDRAVGPTQFIPGTWKRFARDGNGDGKADPQNMYDAAATAAAYLCYFGPGLDTDEGLRGAVIHYNVDQAYVDIVATRAKGYDEFDLPDPPTPSTR
jgi:membrane-bound lytic murein transglycosylase B